eukprot:5622717-Amphidinium_carterae.1
MSPSREEGLEMKCCCSIAFAGCASTPTFVNRLDTIARQSSAVVEEQKLADGCEQSRCLHGLHGLEAGTQNCQCGDDAVGLKLGNVVMSSTPYVVRLPEELPSSFASLCKDPMENLLEHLAMQWEMHLKGKYEAAARAGNASQQAPLVRAQQVLSVPNEGTWEMRAEITTDG